MGLLVLCVTGIIVVYYHATPVSAVRFGNYCPHIGTCTDRNTICLYHLCQCLAGFYRDDTACVPRKTPGTTCELGQCVPNSLCTNGICICNKGYYASPVHHPIVCSPSGVGIAKVNIFLLAFGCVLQLYIRLQHLIY